MSYDLEVLRTKRRDLLLAEVAGWLHDIGKFCDYNIEHHSLQMQGTEGPSYADKCVVDSPTEVTSLNDAISKRRRPPRMNRVFSGKSPKAADYLSQDCKELLRHGIQIAGEQSSLAELIMLSFPSFAAHSNRAELLEGKDGWLPALLGVCHSEAHHDKQEPSGGAQDVRKTLVATAFGYETQQFIVGDPHCSLDVALQSLPLHPAALADPRGLVGAVAAQFSRGLGDTRRPVNEVTLADWGQAVAAMFKAALAATLLTGCRPEICGWLEPGKEIDHGLRWHTLRVGVNGPALYGETSRIPDLLARQELVRELLDGVRSLLADQYPLGSEIYRDELGSAFLLPHLPRDDDGEGLLELLQPAIARCFAESRLAEEVHPQLTIGPACKEAGGLGDLLAPQPAPPRADAQQLAARWRGATADICPVCQLRPQAAQGTAGRRQLCPVCEERRANRAEKWAGRRRTTIWTDEVADVNGRLALVAGRFDLAPWLAGPLVRTLLVSEPADGQAERKNPSFARLRRIWRTTHRFWQAALPTEEGAALAESVVGRALGLSGPRLRITAANAQTLGLQRYHVYDLIVAGLRLSVLCLGDELVSTDNLRYAARLLGAKAEGWQDHLAAAEFVAAILRKLSEVPVEEPAGYGRPARLSGPLQVARVEQEEIGYTPAIPILAEPRTFMALVPANRALEVARALKERYELEMSKVRNRLPLALGLVYFGRRTPLAAALDAGRRLLAGPAGEAGGWEVCSNGECTVARVPPHLEGSPHFAQWRELTLRRGGRQLRLHVSTVMGDGETCDRWYPYFYLDAPAAEHPLERRASRFVAPNPWRGSQESSLVHVADLAQGDRVFLAPCTFDYEFLDTTARRFEVTYEGGRRRGEDRRQRPYHLEELDSLARVWALLSPERIATTQVKALEALVEARRTAWERPRGDDALALDDDDPFRRFCEDALANAGSHRWQADERELLIDAALSGMLADAVELHLTLAKEGDE